MSGGAGRDLGVIGCSSRPTPDARDDFSHTWRTWTRLHGAGPTFAMEPVALATSNHPEEIQIVTKKPKSTVQPVAPASAAAPPPASPATPPAPPTSLITTTANASNHGTKVDIQASVQAVIFGLLTY